MAQWLGRLLRDPELMRSDPLLNLIPGSTSRLHLILKTVFVLLHNYMYHLAKEAPVGSGQLNMNVYVTCAVMQMIWVQMLSSNQKDKGGKQVIYFLRHPS